MPTTTVSYANADAASSTGTASAAAASTTSDSSSFLPDIIASSTANCSSTCAIVTAQVSTCVQGTTNLEIATCSCSDATLSPLLACVECIEADPSNTYGAAPIADYNDFVNQCVSVALANSTSAYPADGPGANTVSPAIATAAPTFGWLTLFSPADLILFRHRLGNLRSIDRHQYRHVLRGIHHLSRIHNVCHRERLLCGVQRERDVHRSVDERGDQGSCWRGSSFRGWSYGVAVVDDCSDRVPSLRQAEARGESGCEGSRAGSRRDGGRGRVFAGAVRPAEVSCSLRRSAHEWRKLCRRELRGQGGSSERVAEASCAVIGRAGCTLVRLAGVAHLHFSTHNSHD